MGLKTSPQNRDQPRIGLLVKKSSFVEAARTKSNYTGLQACALAINRQYIDNKGYEASKAKGKPSVELPRHE